MTSSSAWARPLRAGFRLSASLPLVLPGAAGAQALTSIAPVVIAASRTPQALSSALADVSVVERDEIERAGSGGVADLLARLPGIEFARNGGPGTSTSVFVRGGEARHTAVYLDGVRLDSQSTGGAVWEQIPLEQIERIEVLRGPAAAVYGSDAVAGVVQLFTRQGAGPARPSASVTAGTYGTVQAQAGISGAAAGWNYALSAARGRSSGFDATDAGAYGHNPDRDGWQRSSGQARVGYQLDTKHRLDASWLASDLDSDYDGSATTDDRNLHRLRNASLAWQGRWNADATTRLQIGETRSTYETRPSPYRTETTLRDTTLLHEQRLGTQRLTATLERRDDELFNPATPFATAFGGQRHQDALGLGWRGDFGTQALQAHVRHDDDSEFGARNTGSLAGGWRFAPHWRATASAATAFRVPTLYQRFSNYGNAGLVPESARNVEAGLQWSPAAGEAALTAWRNRVDHLITFGAAGPCVSTYGCYENVGRATLRGVTLSGRTVLAGLALHGSLDWHDPRNADTGQVLPRRARRLASLGADTTLAGWNLGTEVQAAGRRYDDAANAEPLGGYALVNLVAGRPLADGLALQARIDNLADKRYELARHYASAGRSAQLSLRWAL